MLEEYKSHNDGHRYLNLSQLRAKLGGRSRSAIYLDLAAGRLPAPLRLGGRLYWRADELESHLSDIAEAQRAERNEEAHARQNRAKND